MSLKDIARELNIEKYPEEFDKIYDTAKLDYSFCDTEKINAFNDRFDVFKEHTDSVLEAAKAIAENKALSTYCAVIGEYMKDLTSSRIAAVVPLPKVNLGIATDMFALFPLLSATDDWTRRYEEHGFSHDEIKDMYKVIYISLNLSKISIGKSAFTPTYYDWTLLYTYCEIFDVGSFNFQFVKLTSKVIALKNKKTGKHVVMMTERDFHRNGRVLGTPGFEDTEGSFNAEFSETEDAFTGHLACDSIVSAELSVLKKSEWECVVRQGDEVLSIHIPRNADLSIEAIHKSYEDGMRLARERFPEHNPKCLHCASWIIDPQLEMLLGEKSRIVAFGKTFLRFPLGSQGQGRSGFSFVFLGHNGPDETLPEDTSLRRKIKELYLNGGYTYSSAGFVLER